MISVENIFIYAMITIISFVLLSVTFYSYQKCKNKKLLFVSMVILVLFIRGMLLSLSLFYNEIESVTSSAYIWIFDLIVLVLLYAAYSIKR